MVVIDTTEQEYLAALGAAQLLLVDASIEAERLEERLDRKERARDLLVEGFEALSDADPIQTLAAFGESIDGEARTAFLVEVHFLDPFTPYTIRTRLGAFREGLRRVAVAVGAERSEVDRIRAAAESAMQSHRRKRWGRAGMVGVAAAVVLGAAAFVAAPIVGARCPEGHRSTFERD